MLACFTQILSLLASQIRALLTEIAQLIAIDPLWQQLDQAFRSIKGVADRNVARLLAEMPEIGTLSNKAISKLAGLWPATAEKSKVSAPYAVDAPTFVPSCLWSRPWSAVMTPISRPLTSVCKPRENPKRSSASLWLTNSWFG